MQQVDKVSPHLTIQPQQMCNRWAEVAKNLGAPASSSCLPSFGCRLQYKVLMRAYRGCNPDVNGKPASGNWDEYPEHALYLLAYLMADEDELENNTDQIFDDES